jgi:hypothetical protein
MLKDCTVVLLLKDGQLNFNQRLLLRRNTLLYILLESAENIWSNLFVQLVDAVLTLDVSVLFQKVFLTIETLGINEIQQRPKFPAKRKCTVTKD